MRYYCPLCGTEMIEHNSEMWTGQRTQILKYVILCTQKNHKLAIMGSTEEELHINYYNLIIDQKI